MVTAAFLNHLLSMSRNVFLAYIRVIQNQTSNNLLADTPSSSVKCLEHVHQDLVLSRLWLRVTTRAGHKGEHCNNQGVMSSNHVPVLCKHPMWHDPKIMNLVITALILHLLASSWSGKYQSISKYTLKVFADCTDSFLTYPKLNFLSYTIWCFGQKIMSSVSSWFSICIFTIIMVLKSAEQTSHFFGTSNNLTYDIITK